MIDLITYPFTGPRSVPPLHAVDPEDTKLLNRFHSKVTSLLKSVRKADANHPLAPYSIPPAEQAAAAPPDELWEYFNQKLNALILQLSEKEMLWNLVVRGKWGLVGLANLAEYLVREHGVIGGMLKGKLERVMAVIDK